MVSFRLDYRDSKDVKADHKGIQFYDEASLIDAICDTLYENQVEFIVSDSFCENYNMDCMFDLACLLDFTDEILSSLIKREEFEIEFYEQGREYIFLFQIVKKEVWVNVWEGYDKRSARKYKEDYSDIREMFLNFYESLFQYIEKCIQYIDKNENYYGWKKAVNELKKNG